MAAHDARDAPLQGDAVGPTDGLALALAAEDGQHALDALKREVGVARLVLGE